jgi:hypothetical protein
MGAIVMDGAVIGDEVIVGAGALVPAGKRCRRARCGSEPARQHALEAKEIAFLAESAAHYVNLKNDYGNKGTPFNHHRGVRCTLVALKGRPLHFRAGRAPHHRPRSGARRATE